MSSKCRIVGVIYLICGFLGSFYLAYRLGVTARINYRGDLTYDRNMILTVCIFAAGCFTAYMISLLFVSIAQILDNTSKINTIESTTSSTLSKLADEKRQEDLVE